MTYIASEERIAAKCAALALIVGMQDDEDILQGDNYGEGPQDDGQDLNEVIIGWRGGEC